MPDDEYGAAVNSVRMKSRIWGDKESRTVWELMENAFQCCPKKQAISIIEDFVSYMIQSRNWVIDLDGFDKNICYDRSVYIKN